MACRNQKGTRVQTIGNLTRAVWATITFGTLAACSSYEKLPQQAVDGDYRVFLTTTGQGDLKLFLIDIFEVDGKVAMCGGHTSGSSAMSNNASRTFADVSQIYLDDTKIGNSDFLIKMPVYFREGVTPEEVRTQLLGKKPATNCVKSDVDWRPEFIDAEIRSEGPKSVTVFD